ncbi:MAG: helix-turn-helix domain-containing protein, partial [Candidatus Pacearchaeota archaeon]|nr:helix-turn-helix domain-containing protein [Candidatus Pacearchaeota archaeon]
ICEKCAAEEGFPRLKRPDKSIFEEPERRGTVYERMARLSGVKPREPERPELKRQEKTLREIVNRNYEEKIKGQDLSLKARPDLTDNFHWIVMRVRRIKGLTQKELAEKIGESESAVKMAEQGVVPVGYSLIDKLQRFLKVRLIKERNLYSSESNKNHSSSNATELIDRRIQENHGTEAQRYQQKALAFDRQKLDSLTIADLQRMRKEREAAKKEEFIETEKGEDENGN